MGIKGLTSFLENHTPGGTEAVTITQLVKQTIENGASENSTLSSDEKALLVVDTMSCLRDWYQKSSREFLSGGQWKQFKEYLRLFIEQCAKVGLKLIFYMDGPCEQLKRAVWVQRRKETSRKIINAFDKLCQGQTSEFIKPPALSSFTTMYLKEMGQTVLYATGEGDYDTMKYAVESSLCIGVLGMDSDYLAFCGSKPLFPPDRFDPGNNRAVMWKKIALKRHLSLEEEDIPALGCLLGNDLIDDQLLRSFKNKVSPGPGARRAEILVPAVASYLVNFKQTHGHNLKKLQENVIGKSQKESQIFVKIVKSYVFEGKICSWIPSDDLTVGYTESKSINRLKCPNHILEITRERSLSKVYKLLKFGVDDCSNYFEAGFFLPQALLYLSVRRRMYSIVLADVELENPTIEEWYVYEGNPMTGPDIIEPLPLLYKGSQIKLLTLWDKDCSYDLKILALRGCLGLQEKINFDDDDRDVVVEDEAEYWCSGNSLSKYSEHLNVTVFVLRYMAKNLPELVLHDLKSFIATAVKCETMNAKDVSRIGGIKPDGRAAQLATLYIRGLTQLVKVNVVCGSPFNSKAFMPDATFDGILFQQTYQCQSFFKGGFSYIFKDDMEKVDLCENLLNDIIRYLNIPNVQPVSKKHIKSDANSTAYHHDRREGKNHINSQYQGQNRHQTKPHYDAPFSERNESPNHRFSNDSSSYDVSNQRTHGYSRNLNRGNEYKRSYDGEHYNSSGQKYMFEERGNFNPSRQHEGSWGSTQARHNFRGRGNSSFNNCNNKGEYNDSYPGIGNDNCNRGRGRNNFSRGRGNYNSSDWNNGSEYTNNYPKIGNDTWNRGRGRRDFSRGNSRWSGGSYRGNYDKSGARGNYY